MRGWTTTSDASTADVLTVRISLGRPTKTQRSDEVEIKAEDIVYGDYANGDPHGEWIDLIYLDGEYLKSITAKIIRPDEMMDELDIILRDEKRYYLVEIKEVPLGFAFKRNDIVNIKTISNLPGNPGSRVWEIKFKDGNIKTLETTFEAYFAYANTLRPNSMTNAYILDKVLGKTMKGTRRD